jgi:hypothetical protein
MYTLMKWIFILNGAGEGAIPSSRRSRRLRANRKPASNEMKLSIAYRPAKANESAWC